MCRGCSARTRHLLSILSGAVVGTICGFSGAGGGMMMLFLLTSLLSYELKTAVGTSVFIMTFLALVGAISHFTMLGEINWTALVICALSALLGAWLASRFANRATPRLLNRVIGACLVLLGAFHPVQIRAVRSIKHQIRGHAVIRGVPLRVFQV